MSASDGDQFVDGASDADTGTVGEQPEEQYQWYSLKPVVKERKIRVACLHGTASNGQILKMQLAPFMRINGFRDMVEFVFINGSVDATEDPKNHQIANMQKAFPGQSLFQYARYDYESMHGMADYKNVDEFVAHMELQMQANAPIDGIIGFSQGGVLATMLAARALSGDGMPLAFIIHMACVAPPFAYRYKDLFHSQLTIPSLLVWGEKDDFSDNFKLASLYSHPKLLKHSGDHRPFPKDRLEADELASQVFSFMKSAALSEAVGGRLLQQ